MNTDDETTKWMVLENVATLVVTGGVVWAGYYFGLGSFSLFGLLILMNINVIHRPEKF